jgi:serine/threonine protein kinase
VSSTLVANPTSEHGFALVRPTDAVARPLMPLQLEELLGRGAHGSTWRARLPDGSRVAVKRLIAGGEDRAAFLQRLESAIEVHHPNLLDVVRAVEENGELWVVSRLGDGVPLSTLLKTGRMRLGSAVAVGMGVLSGLTALHQAGLWHGAVHGHNVHVDLDGTVRLGDQCLTPAPSGQSSATLRAADVRAAGALICSMLRVPLETGNGAGHGQAPKVASSPLGLAAKAIAGPPRKLPAGYEAAHASLTLWEAARKMATSRRQAQARQDLSAMVTTALGSSRPIVVPSPEPPQPARSRRPAPPADAPARPSTGAPAGAAAAAAATVSSPPLEQLPPPPARDSISPPRHLPLSRPQPREHEIQRTGTRRTLLALLVACGLLVLCLLMVVVSAAPTRRQAVGQTRPVPSAQIGAVPRARVPLPPPPTPVPTAPSFGNVPVTTPITVVPGAPNAPAPPRTATPAPPAAPAVSLANLPPSAAAGISLVTIDTSGCTAGSACTISVEVTLQPSPTRRNVSWTLNSIDLCTGAPVQLATTTVLAQAGWSHVVGLSTVTIPRTPAQVLFAVTDSPGRASSSLAPLGLDHCA